MLFWFIYSFVILFVVCLFNFLASCQGGRLGVVWESSIITFLYRHCNFLLQWGAPGGRSGSLQPLHVLIGGWDLGVGLFKFFKFLKFFKFFKFLSFDRYIFVPKL